MKENMYLLAFVAVFLVVLSTFALVYVESNKGGSLSPVGSNEPSIAASGTAELKVMPDEATLRIKVETKGKTAKIVQDQNSEIMTAVQSALKRAGVDSTDIESDQYNLYPTQEWDPVKQRSVDSGYTLYHTLKIKTTDLDKVGELIGVAVDAGANGIENIEFGLSDKEKLDVKKEALQQAAQSAKDKAEAIASGLGVRLGAIQSITESSYDYAPNYYRGMAAMEMKGGADVSAAPPIEPGQLSISASVSLSYRIA